MHNLGLNYVFVYENIREYLDKCIAAIGFELGYKPNEILDLECHGIDCRGIDWWIEQIKKRNGS